MAFRFFALGAFSAAVALPAAFFFKGDAIFERVVMRLEHSKSKMRKRTLPKQIILVRHGESEGNIDKSIYERVPDNAIELTNKGFEQADEAGKKIKALLGDDTVAFYISPFQRAFQTTRAILRHIDPEQLVNVSIEPRLREQEFGNRQEVSKVGEIRAQQMATGRFWYRFPEGESGADVYHRVASFISDYSLRNNQFLGSPRAQNVVIVSHGLTIRFFLAVLQSWSPDTFETVWNPDNCELWVLELDPNTGRYSVSDRGSKPRSSREVTVHFKDGRKEKVLLEDYLAIPQPRTENGVIAMIRAGIDPNDVEAVDFWNGKFKSNFAYEDHEVGKRRLLAQQN